MRTVSGALFLCQFCVLLFHCTPPPPLSRETLKSLCSSLTIREALCSFKGFGDIVVTRRGDKLKATIDVLWKSDSNFSVAIYGPFGQRVASIVADSADKWEITIKDKVYWKYPDDRIADEEFFDYPFTCKEFVRMLTGRFPDYSVMRKQSDSVSFKGKKAFVHWSGDSLQDRAIDVTAVINRKHSSITDVICLNKNPFPWELSLSSFKKNVPKEIRFKDRDNNYFYLKFETVFVKYGVSCRAERM